jgi:hypothetical protein
VAGRLPWVAGVDEDGAATALGISGGGGGCRAALIRATLTARDAVSTLAVAPAAASGRRQRRGRDGRDGWRRPGTIEAAPS